MYICAYIYICVVVGTVLSSPILISYNYAWYNNTETETSERLPWPTLTKGVPNKFCYNTRDTIPIIILSTQHDYTFSISYTKKQKEKRKEYDRIYNVPNCSRIHTISITAFAIIIPLYFVRTSPEVIKWNLYKSESWEWKRERICIYAWTKIL